MSLFQQLVDLKVERLKAGRHPRFIVVSRTNYERLCSELWRYGGTAPATLTNVDGMDIVILSDDEFAGFKVVDWANEEYTRNTA